MQITEYDLETREGGIRVPSPSMCIYCFRTDQPLTDEHVIPYALGANAQVLEKSCCKSCQEIIQPYEQDVLRRQMGTFRAQVDAPTRSRKKDRLVNVELKFVEVDGNAKIMRELGSRTLAIDEAPLAIGLWSSPPARLFRTDDAPVDLGRPWIYSDKEAALALCRRVGEEEGAINVGFELPGVNRVNYLRSVAKTAHAFAAATLGVGSIEPLLPDLILKRRDDVETFVGDASADSPFNNEPSNTLQIMLGEAQDGPAAGYVFVFIRLYPMLNSPAHMVVVGKALEDIGTRFEAAEV